jgi:hypothetical protein
VRRGERYSDATVQPGTAMTVKEMGPAVATRRAFFFTSAFKEVPPNRTDMLPQNNLLNFVRGHNM